jgi:hypothetical protein
MHGQAGGNTVANCIPGVLIRFHLRFLLHLVRRRDTSILSHAPPLDHEGWPDEPFSISALELPRSSDLKLNAASWTRLSWKALSERVKLSPSLLVYFLCALSGLIFVMQSNNSWMDVIAVLSVPHPKLFVNTSTFHVTYTKTRVSSTMINSRFCVSTLLDVLWNLQNESCSLIDIWL